MDRLDVYFKQQEGFPNQADDFAEQTAEFPQYSDGFADRLEVYFKQQEGFPTQPEDFRN